MAHFIKKIMNEGAVVVTGFVERSLHTPEVCGLNPVIGELFYWKFDYYKLLREEENKEKEAGSGPFKNDISKWP